MINVFIAYSHKDIHFKNDLKKFLTPLKREKKINIWDDYDIEAGEDWSGKIKENLYSSKIVILLVSPDSLASDYFYEEEFAISMERHSKGEVIITPVILRHCDLESTPLKSLEFLPDKGKPIVDWPTNDHAWKNVVDRLKLVIENLETSNTAKANKGNTESEADNLFQTSIVPEKVSIAVENYIPDDTLYSAVLYSDGIGMYRIYYEYYFVRRYFTYETNKKYNIKSFSSKIPMLVAGGDKEAYDANKFSEEMDFLSNKANVYLVLLGQYNRNFSFEQQKLSSDSFNDILSSRYERSLIIPIYAYQPKEMPNVLSKLSGLPTFPYRDLSPESLDLSKFDRLPNHLLPDRARSVFYGIDQSIENFIKTRKKQ